METGAKLRRARIESGISLAHIVSVTKISRRVLERIEAGRFEELPGGILTRGYLRAFASEIGLDPDEVVREYREQFERTTPEDEPSKLRKSDVETEPRATRTSVIVAIASAVIVYFGLVRTPNTPSAMETGAGTPVDAVGTRGIARAVAPAQTLHPDGASAVRAGDPKGLQIELRPRAECWVSATADGRLVIYRLLHGGERATIDAVDEIRLRIGDAGVLAYAVNGQPGRSLGDLGEAVTVHVTSDNATTWLTAEPVESGAGTSPTRVSTQRVTGI